MENLMLEKFDLEKIISKQKKDLNLIKKNSILNFHEKNEINSNKNLIEDFKYFKF